jgi:murein DD-endopeptidase MepM/ murein hydrolase activator NlpD
MKVLQKYSFFTLVLLSVFLFGATVYAQGNSSEIDELREKIDDRSSKIKALEVEIEKYEEELEVVGKEKETLQSAVKSLDLSQAKLQTEMNITENRVSATTFQISKLALEISDKQKKIDLHSDTLAQSIRIINETDNLTFVEQMLASSNFADLWSQVEDLQRFQSNLQANLLELKSLKAELLEDKAEREGRRRQLLNYNQDLSEQKRAVGITKTEKTSLLNQTKSKESNYKSLLEEKREARLQFEQELLDFESQLQIAIDPDSIPTPNKNILSSPLEKPRLTQKFGDTAFAQSGAYNGKGHNGIDFGTAVGTRVKAALSGTIEATGNTDAIKGCYSYGKWVLLKHNNGLSTLYAHLSHISLGEGSNVVTGQTIGYSGNTGYSTGPHLHFTLFATQGVRVVRFGDIKTVTNCADAYVPVAPHKAYLDPLQYLDY